MSKSYRLVPILFAFVLSILSIPAMAESNYTVNLTADKFLGSYLINQSGFTLYYFAQDSDAAGGSACYDDCAVMWPAFYAGDDLSLPESLRSSDFASIMRTDGSKQTTYRGWPLYLYSEDHAEGDINGQGEQDGLWNIINPDDLPQMI
jgi:predicted lipoprotein with Yx(FWY)xxD motif